MTSVRRLALVGLNVCLLGASCRVLIGEDRAPPDEPPAARAPAPILASVSQTPPTAIAKPLFRIAPPVPAAVQENPPPSPTAPGFRLAGVVWSDAEKVAVVQMIEDGAHRRVRVGDVIGEWTLRELSTRTATVEAGANTVRMQLTVSPAQ